MDRLDSLIAQLPSLPRDIKDIMRSRMEARSPREREGCAAVLATYIEERQALETEYQEAKRLLDQELAQGLDRYAESGKDLLSSLRKHEEALEIAPDTLIAL